MTPSGGVALVVDDDAATRMLYDRALRAAGFMVHAAPDGEQALALLAEAPVDVVLLDDGLPGMTGIEVLGAIRATPDGVTLPVLMVTGRDALQDRVAGLDAGATDYVVKPVDIVELIARVRTHVRSGTAWSGMRAELERRLDAITLLRRVRRHDDAVATARAVCDELLQLEDIDGAALLVLRGPDVSFMAAAGSLAGWDDPEWSLAPAAGRALGERIRGGPWMRAGLPARRPELGEAVELAVPGTLAVAPLDGDSGTVGAIALAATAARRGATQLLSAAIDLSVAVASLVVPEIERSGEVDGRRRRVRDAVHGQGFVPVYQPVVRLADDAVLGYEALTRWTDGVAPAERFAEAAAIGIAGEVERETVRVALAGAAGLPDDVWLSVNASFSAFGSRELHAVLADAGRPVVVEITEHEPIDDEDALRAALAELPGVRLAVDDAGAGYASLQRVHSLRPDFVKLDLVWARGIDGDRARQALVGGMVRFAEECGSRIIAEGIETTDERDALRALGVEFGQGYLLGRPAPLTP